MPSKNFIDCLLVMQINFVQLKNEFHFVVVEIVGYIAFGVRYSPMTGQF